jgi:hypothetical protein
MCVKDVHERRLRGISSLARDARAKYFNMKPFVTRAGERCAVWMIEDRKIPAGNSHASDVMRDETRENRNGIFSP